MTPEELVRQAILKELILKGYPKELIVVEKGIKEIARTLLHVNPSASLKRRIDILCCANLEKISPLLLIECKAYKLKSQDLRQVGGYNHFIGAPLYAIANALRIEIACHLDENLLFSIPSYAEAIKMCYGKK
jgi:Type I restriction enzyme R protein N terminus (HSDR_N)